MAIVHRVFIYSDGHREDDTFDSGSEHYGVGETLERDGIRWRATEGRSLEDPGHVELIFAPEEE